MAGEGENAPGAPPNYVWPPANWLDSLPGAMPGVVPPPASDGAAPPPNVDMSGVEPMYVGAQPPPVDMSGVEPMQVGNQAPPVATAEAAPNSPPDGAGVPPAVAAPASPDPQAAMYGVPMAQPEQAPGAPPPPPPSTDTAAPGVPPPDAQAAMYGVPSNKPPEPQLVGHELTTDEGEQDATARALANMTPTQRQLYYKQDEINRANERMRLESEAQTADLDRANRNASDVIQAANDAKAKTDADIARADVLAKTKIDPQRGAGSWISRLILGAIGGFVSSMTGGRNLALEQFNKNIADDIDAQKADIENGYKAIGTRRTAVAEEFARHQDIYRASETARLAANKAALTQIDTRMQDYHPGSAAAIALAKTRDQITANIDQQTATIHQQNFKNSIDAIKAAAAVQKDLADANLANASADKKREAGTGTGNLGANASYMVPTGYFDPFDETQPIMGKRAVGGKGEDPKERDQLEQQLQTYKHVNDTLTKMRTIATELGDGGKGTDEAIWKGRKSTLGADYDAAKEELTSYLTKAIGDRPTQGQLELQAHRIPDRKTVFEAADPVKLLDSQADAADRAFKADLDVIGVNAVPTITRAKGARVITTAPQAADQLSGALDAEAGAKTSSDKKAASKARDAAKARVEAEAADQQRTTEAIKAAATFTPFSLIPVDSVANEWTPKQIADGKAINEAARSYNAHLSAYAKLHSAKKPDAKAIGVAARKLVDAKRVLDEQDHTMAADGFIDTTFHP